MNFILRGGCITAHALYVHEVCSYHKSYLLSAHGWMYVWQALNSYKYGLPIYCTFTTPSPLYKAYLEYVAKIRQGQSTTAY